MVQFIVLHYDYQSNYVLRFFTIIMITILSITLELRQTYIRYTTSNRLTLLMISEMMLNGDDRFFLQADVFLAPQIAAASKRFNIDMVNQLSLWLLSQPPFSSSSYSIQHACVSCFFMMIDSMMQHKPVPAVQVSHSVCSI